MWYVWVKEMLGRWFNCVWCRGLPLTCFAHFRKLKLTASVQLATFVLDSSKRQSPWPSPAGNVLLSLADGRALSLRWETTPTPPQQRGASAQWLWSWRLSSLWMFGCLWFGSFSTRRDRMVPTEETFSVRYTWTWSKIWAAPTEIFLGSQIQIK